MPSIKRPPAAGQSGPATVRARPANPPPETPWTPEEREVAGWLGVPVDPGQVVEMRAPKANRPGVVSFEKREGQILVGTRPSLVLIPGVGRAPESLAIPQSTLRKLQG